MSNLNFPDDEFDWYWQHQQSEGIYVFHYHDEKLKKFLPYFGLHSKNFGNIQRARQQKGFHEIELFAGLNHPYTSYNAELLEMRVVFFSEVFNERPFIGSYLPSHKLFRVILPDKVYVEIMECINEYKLLPIRDLLLEVIAMAQKMYVNQIAAWESPVMKQMINTADREAKKVIELIDKMNDNDGKSKNKKVKLPADINSAKFIFSDETMKINHPWLVREIFDAFKDSLNQDSYHDWRRDLQTYSRRYAMGIKAQQFKYSLTLSFYNLLTKTSAIKVTSKAPTPNYLMICIAKLLEFCLVPVGKPDELDNVKAKTIRNWISRKKLKPTPAYAQIEPEHERLLKYFQQDFVEICGNIKRADAIDIGEYFADRFELPHLTADLIHIVAGLKEYKYVLGNQLISGSPFMEPDFQEFTDFSLLVKGIRSGEKLTSIEFTMDGNEGKGRLIQPLPLRLIEKALKFYASEHQVEFDTDVIKVGIKKAEDDGFDITNYKTFREPKERFLVQFVKSFYDYLLAEIPPPDEFDIIPAERYYIIIAKMLQMTGHFYHRHHSESFIIGKVKEWHELTTNIYESPFG